MPIVDGEALRLGWYQVASWAGVAIDRDAVARRVAQPIQWAERIRQLSVKQREQLLDLGILIEQAPCLERVIMLEYRGNSRRVRNRRT